MSLALFLTRKRRLKTWSFPLFSPQLTTYMDARIEAINMLLTKIVSIIEFYLFSINSKSYKEFYN